MKYQTTELFVSFRIDSQIEGGIFTVREEADLENDKNNDTYEELSNRYNPSEKNKRPYVVKDLYDAIEDIKDYVKDQVEIDRWNNEDN
jgi:hypothetical protein